MPWCAKVHYRTRTRVTCFGNTMGIPVPMRNPKYQANVFYVRLSHLQYIHSRTFIHRNLKPSNLVMGVGKPADLVYFIDFSLLKEFRDPNTHMHIPYKDALSLTRTATFASIPSHLVQN